jgi:molybdenum cofactor synthesis domain-containing protein
MSSSLLGPTAAVLVIGEEILSGKVDDENARYLVQELRELGVALRRIEVVPDDIGEIVEAVRTMSAGYDHVFTSGGVGPTHDDLTMQAISVAFESPLERRAELERLIRGSMAGDFQERDLRMADVPVAARLIYGEPPDSARWPVIAVNNVFILPGVPSIFRRKFASVRELFRAGPIHSQALYSRESEGTIAATLDAVVAEFPMVAIGSYPRLDAPEYKVKITLDGRDASAVESASVALRERLGAALVRG